MLALLLLAGALGGCQPDRSFAVVLIADRTQDQWDSVDLPALEDRVAERCEGCELEIRSAGGDPDTQADQFDAALEEGADVVVIDPVDPAAAEDLVSRAGSVPVTAWRTLVPGADLYVGTDPERVAGLLASEVERLAPPRGRVLALRPGGGEGAAQVEAVARRLSGRLTLDRAEVGAGGAAQAAREAGPTAYAVVLAPTDALAAAVAPALTGSRAPALVAPGAGLEAARRVVTGAQAAGVHEPRAELARLVADVTVAHLAGGEPPRPNGEVEGVDALLAQPRAVTLSTLTEVMVRDGAVTLDALCAGATRGRCKALGIY